MDPRTTPANGRIAHVTLRSKLDAARYVEGSRHRITAALTDLCTEPDGARARQLLMGARVLVLEEREGWAFIQAEHDGYVGYVPVGAVGADAPVTHMVAAAATHLYPRPDLRAREIAALSLGAMLYVAGDAGSFARTAEGAYVPRVHLRALDAPFVDPVGVAERLLGTPYLWGGNSHSGIDCSGLVQLGCRACAIDCPGDSDQQAAALGVPIADAAPLRRGDLMFWKGHVAWVAAPDTLLHANAFAMAVAFEPLAAAIARISEQGEGPVIARRRLPLAVSSR